MARRSSPTAGIQRIEQPLAMPCDAAQPRLGSSLGFHLFEEFVPRKYSKASTPGLATWKGRLKFSWRSGLNPCAGRGSWETNGPPKCRYWIRAMMLSRTAGRRHLPPEPVRCAPQQWPGIVGLLQPHAKALVLGVFAVLGEGAANLLEPWPLKFVFDSCQPLIADARLVKPLDPIRRRTRQDCNPEVCRPRGDRHRPAGCRMFLC